MFLFFFGVVTKFLKVEIARFADIRRIAEFLKSKEARLYTTQQLSLSMQLVSTKSGNPGNSATQQTE